MDLTGPSKQKNKFYAGAYIYFLIAALVTIAAFYPSYFSRLELTDSAHHLHGITAFLWMLLLIIQPYLYRIGKLKWHIVLGRSSFLLVPSIVISALNMVRVMIIGQAVYPPLLPYQLSFIDFFTILLFILFFGLAMLHRKNIQNHARYMVCTVLGPLIPALTRLLFWVPFIDNFDKSLNISFILIELVLVLLLLDDKRTGKFSFPYKLALILFLIQHLLMNYASGWHWWHALMDAFAGI